MENLVFKSKKSASGEIYLSPWVFLNWAFVGLAVVIVVLMFLSAQADTREREAYIMNVRLFDCISQDFNYSEYQSSSFDIYSKCDFNKELFDNTKAHFFSISIICDKKLSFSGGANGLEKDCFISSSDQSSYKNLAKCVSQRFFIIDNFSGNTCDLQINTVSNQK